MLCFRLPQFVFLISPICTCSSNLWYSILWFTFTFHFIVHFHFHFCPNWFSQCHSVTSHNSRFKGFSSVLEQEIGTSPHPPLLNEYFPPKHPFAHFCMVNTLFYSAPCLMFLPIFRCFENIWKHCFHIFWDHKTIICHRDDNGSNLICIGSWGVHRGFRESPCFPVVPDLISQFRPNFKIQTKFQVYILFLLSPWSISFLICFAEIAPICFGP